MAFPQTIGEYQTLLKIVNHAANNPECVDLELEQQRQVEGFAVSLAQLLERLHGKIPYKAKITVRDGENEYHRDVYFLCAAGKDPAIMALRIGANYINNSGSLYSGFADTFEFEGDHRHVQVDTAELVSPLQFIFGNNFAYNEY